MNEHYKHGLGRLGARDVTKSGDPATNFFHSTRLYRVAISYNKGLDRDHDGIACERASKSNDVPDDRPPARLRDRRVRCGGGVAVE